MRILHFSDPHVTIPLYRVPLGKWFGKRALGGANLLKGRHKLFAGAEEKLAALARFCKTEQMDLVLCSGDYVALGLQREYEYALHCVRPLMDAPYGYLNVPGNHDLYVKDALREKYFTIYFGQNLHSDLPEYQVDGLWPLVRLIDENLAVVCVNSARPNLLWRSSGQIPEQQIVALQKIAIDERITHRLVCIMTHYAPLLEDGTPDSKLHGLRNYKAFLAACGAFEEAIILCGHVHRCYSAEVLETGQRIFCAGSLTMEGREGFWCFDIQGRTVRAIPGIWNGEKFILDTKWTIVLNQSKETTMDAQKAMEEVRETVKQIRDEVALKAHLGKAEAAEELEKLEKKWDKLKQEFKPYTDNVEEKAGDAGAALELAAEELKAGFKRLRDIL